MRVLGWSGEVSSAILAPNVVTTLECLESGESVLKMTARQHRSTQHTAHSTQRTFSDPLIMK